MPKPVSRSPGILDGMILMVGIAVGTLLTRLYLVNNYDSSFAKLEDNPTTRDYVRWIMGEAADFACLWLLALTPLAFLIRMRRPRPPLRRLMVQPGATALVAVMVVLLFCSMLAAGAVALEGAGPWFYFYQNYLIRLFPYIGAAVAVVWSLQALARRWKPEAGAIDRFGRFLGTCWIAMFLGGTLAMLQQGVLNSAAWPKMAQTLEAADAAIEVSRAEYLTNQRRFLEGRLRRAETRTARLGRLIETGDHAALKAELRQRLEGEAEGMRTIRGEIDELEREARTPPGSSPVSPFESPPEPPLLTPFPEEPSPSNDVPSKSAPGPLSDG